MALDLFLAPYKPKSRSKSAVAKARQALVDALSQAHPDTALHGDVSTGHIENFPLGELQFSPGDIHWAMHGVDDEAPVHAMADWFFDQGFRVKDPQGAGFGRPREAMPQDREELEALIGGAWLGLRFDRTWGHALEFEFALADGRLATMRFLHFTACAIPDLEPLVNARIEGIGYEPAGTPPGSFETVTVRFEGGHALVVTESVLDLGGVRVREAPPQR